MARLPDKQAVKFTDKISLLAHMFMIQAWSKQHFIKGKALTICNNIGRAVA